MLTDDLMAKKGTTSFVWNFFGVKKNDDSDKDTAVCRLCCKSVLARGGNTSNLTSHLRNNHAKEYATVTQVKESKKKKQKGTSQKAKQLTIPAAVERKTPYENGSKRSQEITNTVTEFIAKEMMPVNVVE